MDEIPVFEIYPQGFLTLQNKIQMNQEQTKCQKRVNASHTGE